MSYFPASSACNGPNGLLPLPAALVARAQRQLATVDTAEKRARSAVLGYCTNPASFPGLPNIQSEIAASPSMAQAVQNYVSSAAGSVTDGVASISGAAAASPAGAVSSVVPSTPGAGVSRPPSCWDNRPLVPVAGQPLTPPVPYQLAPAPVFASVQSAPVAVVQPVSVLAAPVASVPATPQFRQYLLPPRPQRPMRGEGMGDLPPWGDSFQPADGGAAAAPGAAVASWVSDNPGVVAAAFLAAVALLFGKS
jgi:hypothetical protein